MVQTFSPFSNNTRDVEDFADYDNYEIKMTLRRKRCPSFCKKKKNPGFMMSRAIESFGFIDLNKRNLLGPTCSLNAKIQKKNLTKN